MPDKINGGSRPIPDPTTLTTEQIKEAIQGLRQIIDTRLDGMDKAIELVQQSTDRLPSHVKAAVGQLQELHQEKFNTIAIQFAERDARVEQMSRDSKVAVDTALQAAKENVGKQQEVSDRSIAKTEFSTTKQIDQIGVLIASTNKAVDDKIDDMKKRLTTIEGMALGGSNTVGTTFSLVAVAGTVVSMIVAIISVVVVLSKG